MKLFIYLFFIVISFNAKGQALLQTNTQMKETETVGDFTIELNKFIDKVNKEYYKINEYFVFVVYVYKSDSNCNAYTIGFIFNEKDLKRVVPQYQIIDSNSVVLVSFAPDIHKDSIPGINLVKINPEEKEQIRNRLLKEDEGYITGVFYGLGYKKCGDNLEKIFYDNSDLIPREQSIFQSFPFGGKIEMIKEGD